VYTATCSAHLQLEMSRDVYINESKLSHFLCFVTFSSIVRKHRRALRSASLLPTQLCWSRTSGSDGAGRRGALPPGSRRKNELKNETENFNYGTMLKVESVVKSVPGV
jgi:hypothetical protein